MLQINDILNQTNINLNANTNANANTSGDRIDRVINNNKKDFKLIRKYINKLLRYESHLVINKLHNNAKTTPKSLFYERFPSPFFQEDSVFIDSYNKIIEKVQIEIMTLIKETLEIRITKTKQKIQEYKDDSLNLSKYSEFDPQDIIKSIYKTEERSLLDTFVKNKSKAERCISKPFEPKANSNDSTRSSNASIHSNHSSRSNQSVSWSNRNSYNRYSNQSQSLNNNNHTSNNRTYNNNNNHQNNYNRNDYNQNNHISTNRNPHNRNQNSQINNNNLSNDIGQLNSNQQYFNNSNRHQNNSQSYFNNYQNHHNRNNYNQTNSHQYYNQNNRPHNNSNNLSNQQNNNNPNFKATITITETIKYRH